LGLAGILSLGSALFFGIGAYGVAILMRAGFGFASGVLVGIAVAGGLAWLIGSAALTHRKTSIQFSLLMLVVSLSAEQIIISAYGFTGGSNGISNIQIPSILSQYGLSAYFGFLFVVVVFILIAMFQLARSRFGWLLVLQREDPRLAEALGYNVKETKLIATLLAAILSAVAGAFYAPLIGIAYPAMFGVLPNMLVLVWVAMGGAGTLLGPFFAAAALTLLQFSIGSEFFDWYLLGIGVAFVVAVVWAPAGLWPSGSRSAPLRRW
jgi:ABC-type branched-subunit amino acid transport system permease subunit